MLNGQQIDVASRQRLRTAEAHLRPFRNFALTDGCRSLPFAAYYVTLNTAKFAKQLDGPALPFLVCRIRGC